MIAQKGLDMLVGCPMSMIMGIDHFNILDGDTQHLLTSICGITTERIPYEMLVMQRSTERL